VRVVAHIFLNYLIPIITVVISVLSLVIAINTHRLNRPRIKIELIGQDNAFYGATSDHFGEKYQLTKYMAGVHMRIKNLSSRSLTIGEISLKYDGNIYDLANPQIDIHNEIEFYFMREGQITTNGSCINYKEEGIILPYELASF
jgi:hypothetical protein